MHTLMRPGSESDMVHEDLETRSHLQLASRPNSRGITAKEHRDQVETKQIWWQEMQDRTIELDDQSIEKVIQQELSGSSRDLVILASDASKIREVLRNTRRQLEILASVCPDHILQKRETGDDPGMMTSVTGLVKYLAERRAWPTATELLQQVTSQFQESPDIEWHVPSRRASAISSVNSSNLEPKDRRNAESQATTVLEIPETPQHSYDFGLDVDTPRDRDIVPRHTPIRGTLDQSQVSDVIGFPGSELKSEPAGRGATAVEATSIVQSIEMDETRLTSTPVEHYTVGLDHFNLGPAHVQALVHGTVFGAQIGKAIRTERTTYMQAFGTDDGRHTTKRIEDDRTQSVIEIPETPAPSEVSYTSVTSEVDSLQTSSAPHPRSSVPLREAPLSVQTAIPAVPPTMTRTNSRLSATVAIGSRRSTRSVTPRLSYVEVDSNDEDEKRITKKRKTARRTKRDDAELEWSSSKTSRVTLEGKAAATGGKRRRKKRAADEDTDAELVTPKKRLRRREKKGLEVEVEEST